MSPSAKKAKRRAPRSLLLLPVFLLVLLGLVAAGPWPESPDQDAARRGRTEGEAAADYRYAAGLYRALEAAAGDAPTDAEALRLARAQAGQGQEDHARRLLAGRDSLPADLALVLRLAESERPWSDLERERWRRILDGGDGESLYWRARLELALGDGAAARERLRTLLRREPGSVFAPAALELMEALPPAPAQRADRVAEAAPADADGVRVQWGVFRDPHGARRHADALAAYGQKAEILLLRRGGEDLYRVVSPPFADEGGARARGEELRERYGLDFVLLREEGP
ncbi:MAG: SPOR domain-containing protein [Candidatus Krumholzibacteriota bacterium]|nr:SPOR domain-containing protein [Candidatus Krumholzibacteriota bacterium]